MFLQLTWICLNVFMFTFLWNGMIGAPLHRSDIKETTKVVQKRVDVKTLGDARRCGTKDVEMPSHHRRRKKYVVQRSRWKKQELTWKIESHTEDLPKHVSRSTIRKAFKVWASWVPLKFRERTSGDVDITIRFESGIHLPCKIAFDGKGRSIAHAFYPSDGEDIGGDIHFDDSEDFTVNRGVGGTSLGWTALHEIGHSLGLKHSSIYGVIMSPYYRSFYHSGIELSLSTDDIRGVQAIYGKPT